MGNGRGRGGERGKISDETLNRLEKRKGEEKRRFHAEQAER